MESGSGKSLGSVKSLAFCGFSASSVCSTGGGLITRKPGFVRGSEISFAKLVARCARAVAPLIGGAMSRGEVISVVVANDGTDGAVVGVGSRPIALVVGGGASPWHPPRTMTPATAAIYNRDLTMTPSVVVVPDQHPCRSLICETCDYRSAKRLCKTERYSAAESLGSCIYCRRNADLADINAYACIDWKSSNSLTK